jgi:pimeloyl-ACP methyl ester carboxylesterase
MSERPIYFGPEPGLLGVLTRPETPDPAKPAVVLLNAGLLHRVGPNRLHVDVARRLADRGHHVLRFDMSGVGDSGLGDGGLLYIDRSKRDVVEAMDALEAELGSERFVLMGLCTGAFNAFRAALVDDRVVGAVLLDGYAYPTLRSRFEHYRTRVFQLDRWIGYVRRRLGLAGDGGAPGEDLVVFENEVVPRDRFAAELAALIERDVALLMVFTGMGPLAFTYERQMHAAFPEIDLDRTVQVEYHPNADHTFTLPGNRERLMATIENWMSTRWTPASPAAPTTDGGSA